MLESIFSANVFLGDVQLVNLLSTLLTIVLGTIVFFHDRKNVVNQIAFLMSLFLAYWALSSTLTDIMRSHDQALFWARSAYIGPVYFFGLLVIFSYFFPAPARKLPAWKAFAIMGPSLAVLPFVLTPYNVIDVRFMEWGTDFTPGILFYLGLPYGVGFLVWAAVRFYRLRRHCVDVLQRSQILLVFWACAIVLISLLITNVILPLVFSYTQASVWGALASLAFVVLMSYAIFAKGALSVKVISAELCCYILIFVTTAEVLVSVSVAMLIRRLLVLMCVTIVSVFLIRSVRKEVEQRKELEKLSVELAAKNEKLKEMDTLKSDFISIASHQLRTPTSVIKGYLALMLDGAYGKVDGPMREKVVAMADMAERLVIMINEMLNVSRIERNRITYACERVDVAESARVIVNELENKAAERKIGLRLVTRDPSGTAMAVADNDKFKEALSNIIDNAIKYSTHGTVEVTVQSRPTHKDVLVQVSDEGLGIAAEDINHMFEKFYRSGNPEVARQTGTGLGLYVCRIFLRDMGGDVWVERSALGKGTVFSLTLPSEPKNPNGVCTFKP